MSNLLYIGLGYISNETKHRCTYAHFEEFILVEVVALLYKLELKMWIGIFTGLYTIATIEEKG